MSLDVDVAARFTADGTDPFDVDVTLSVEAGQTLVVLGPSGSGKSLLLETVAGFHTHHGSVIHADRDLTDQPPEVRKFGFVFQDYALFPHLTVRENVDFGGRYHDDTRDADALLTELGVGHLADRRPTTLSGGEKQRVALARALAIRPDAMLLDEPLSALDVPTRQSLRDDLASLLADVTAIYVTHNRTTARALADRIAIMRDGRIVQTGTPDRVFESPASPFVARFTGANCLPTGSLPGAYEGREVAIRPEHVVLGGDASDFEATVERVTREDAACRVTLVVGETQLDAYTVDPPAVGERVDVTLPREHLTAFED